MLKVKMDNLGDGIVNNNHFTKHKVSSHEHMKSVNVKMNERVFCVPFNTLLGCIRTATSNSGMK